MAVFTLYSAINITPRKQIIDSIMENMIKYVFSLTKLHVARGRRSVKSSFTLTILGVVLGAGPAYTAYPWPVPAGRPCVPGRRYPRFPRASRHVSPGQQRANSQHPTSESGTNNKKAAPL